MKSAWLVACIAAVFATVACNPFSPNQSVILAVTKLEAPATVAPAGPLSVTLTVQFGGCISFNRIDVQRFAGGARLIPWGTDASIGHKDLVCPSILHEESHSVQVDPPFVDPFNILVEQGALAPVTAVVRVQ
jgi:hypothetical protein